MKVGLEHFDVKLDDGQTYQQSIWITNNLRSHVQVESISCKEKEHLLKLTRPWHIRSRLAQEKEAEGTNFENYSPVDFWKIEYGQKKPIGEISYTASYDGMDGRHLLSANIKVTVKQNIANTDSTASKDIFIPMRFFKRYFSSLVEEDFIDLGIVTSKEVTHRYYLKVENRFGKPAVITQVSVEKFGGGMVFRVGTMFGYKVVLPPSGPPFDLVVLYAQADDKFDLGYVWGTIKIFVDVSGQQEIITVPFQACYYHNMFSEEERVSFELKRNFKEGKIMNRMDGFITNNYLTDIVIHDISFVDFESNKNSVSFTSLTRFRRLSPGDSSKAFAAQFNFQESYFDNTFSRGYEVANVKALGTFGSVLVQYYTMNLMCGLHNSVSSVYEKCKNIEKLEFSYVAVGHRKVMTMDMYNPTMVSYIIKRIEFSANSGNIEIAFENQSRNGMKSYFKKATKTMNTFVMLPRNDVVSLRVKVKPRETGSFKETISIYTNHGEFSLSVIYKGIQGEILFIPTTLRYDLFYPIESDEKQVAARNKFNIEVRISNAWSPQTYIFANLRQFSLKENSKDTFLGVILDLTDDEIMETERSGFLRTFNDQMVTLSDLVSLEDQIVGWDKILREAKTEISGEVIVQTDLLSDMKINVKGFIRKALFVPEDKVAVGPLEEKRSHLINITLHNPTERDVTMRFYIADPRMTDLKAIHKKVLSRLKKKYAKFQKEQVCLTHASFDEEAIKYYANALFEGVTIKSVGLSKNKKNKVCFQVDHPKPLHSKFFTFKGNYMFNSTRLSRKNMIRDNMDVYVLRDVVKLSNRKPPANPQSLYSLSLYEKLQMLVLHLKALIRSKFKKASKFKTKGSTKFISSLKKDLFDSILQKQEFFINPKYRNKKLILPAGQSQTVPAVICHPQETGDLKVNLLIKNDYSNLIILPITAQLGKISLIVHKVVYLNEGTTTTSIILKKEEYHKMTFSISSADLIQKLGSTKDSKKVFFKKNIKRIFELKNNGNLPIKVNSISVDKQGCTFNGFKIINCMAFELPPGQTHRLEVMLLNTYDFQSEFKREVYFIMDSRVLVLEFEVRTSDPLMSDLSNYGYVSSISHLFKLVVLIFIVVLGLILYKHYHDKHNEQGYFVTDLEKSRFGNNLYFDNIFDLKVLEANVKFQKLEAQKNRMIRAVGLKELMTNNLKENNSKDHSIISEQPEEIPKAIERVQLTEVKNYPREPEIVERQPELIYQPTKGKKNKRPKKPSATATPVKIETHEDHPEIHISTDNILDPIKNDIEEKKLDRPENVSRYRKEEYQTREASQYREIREAREKEAREAREIKEREARDIREREMREAREREAKENYYSNKRHKHKKSYGNQSEEEEYYQKKDTPTQENQVIHQKPEDNLKPSDKSLSKRRESIKSDNDSMAEIEKPELPADKKRKVSEHVEKKVSPPTSTPRKTSLVEREAPEQNLQTLSKPLEHSSSQPRKQSIPPPSEKPLTEPEGVSPIPSEVPEPVRVSTEIVNRKREPVQKVPEKSSDRNRGRKKEVIYYQRIEKPTEDSEEPSHTERERLQAGLPKLSVKEESTGTAISSQLATGAKLPDSGPKHTNEPLSSSDQSRAKKTSPIHPKGTRIHPNRSFSQEGEEELPQDHRSFDRFNQTINDISEIVNAEENSSNTSNIMLLRDNPEDRDRGVVDKLVAHRKTSPPNINAEDSDDSEENMEKSREKISKLMEDTEEVFINYDNEERKKEVQALPKIVGVIGGEKKKDAPSSRIIGSNFLGFRQSENNIHQPGRFMSYVPMTEIRPKTQQPLPALLSPLSQRMPNPIQQSEVNSKRPTNPQTSTYSPYYGAQQIPASIPTEVRPKQQLQFKAYHNPYGTFISREPAQPVHIQKPVPQYQDNYYSKGNEYGQFYNSSSGSYGYENEEQNNQEEDYPMEEEGQYYDAYEEEYSEADAEGYPVAQGRADYDNKQFKAAMNNPFTLRNLAGGKTDSPPQPQNYLGWMNQQNSYSQGEDDYEKSGYSAPSYSQTKGGMKPPPGLSNENDNLAEEDLPYQPRRTQPAVTNQEETASRNQNKLKLKRLDKPKYNMFG